MAVDNSIIEQHRPKRSRTYNAWAGMKQRCLNPKHHKFHHYGQRGITVCDEWLTFDGFLSDMGEAPEGKTLNRINNNYGYTKSNCCWSTPTEQNQNRRNNITFTYQGETLCLKEWAARLKVPYSKLYWRLMKSGNWTVEMAFSK